MARAKKVTTEEETEETPKKKKGGSLIDRMKAASTATSSILDQDEFPIKRYISTGNYMLNALISADPFLGIPTGRSVQLAGQKGVGKTLIGLEILKNAQKDFGYTAQILDSEFANNDKRAMQERGIDVKNTLWTGIDTIEQTKTEILRQIDEIEKGEDLIMLVDSIGMLPTEKEIIESKTTEKEKKDMTRAQALKSLFRTITMPLGYKDIPLIAINHVYASTGSFIPMDVVAGGGGPAYGTSIIVLFSKSQLKEGDEVVGASIRAKTDKNRFAKEKSECRFTIEFDGGLNMYSGLLEFCVDHDLLVCASKIPKSGDVRKVKSFYFLGNEDKEIKNSQLTPQFWEWYLRNGLGAALKEAFSYKPATEGIEPAAEFDSSFLTD